MRALLALLIFSSNDNGFFLPYPIDISGFHQRSGPLVFLFLVFAECFALMFINPYCLEFSESSLA